ncbi:hypothetical protein EJB05_19458, partial [Eragrostis curvula]
MGCKGSKLDDQEAVALCRGRADLLAAAVRHRYALADAHGALGDSLASVAAALHLLMTASSSSSQPRLVLPAAGKGVDAPPPPLQAQQQRPGSSPPHSSSHIDFAPSSDSESSSASSSPRRDHHLHHHPHQPPTALPYPHYGYGGYGYPAEPPFGVYPTGSLRLYYGRSRPPPASVAVVEQRAAPPPERVYFGYSEPSARVYPEYYHPYGGGEPMKAGRTAAPPPPPSPPRESSWDFFNVFADYDVYDNYCYDTGGAGAAAAYTPSRSSREVREEEGIPELEDEDAVVVKQVDSEYSGPGSGARSRRSSLGGVSNAEADQVENSVVDKEVTGRVNVAHQQATTQRNVAAPAPAVARGPVEGSDVAGQIKRQFVAASDAVRTLAPILEVGRRRHHHRSSVYHVSSRMVSAVVMPYPDHGPVELLDGAEEKVIGGTSLGAETDKIDKTRNLLRKLSTKIRISVRVITKVSKKINRIRDDELWPQINALVRGFVRMWQDKLDCYQIQCQVMSDAKDLDFVSRGSSRELAMELELELIKWIVSFSCWVNAQRSFVKALNGWLALCLNYKADEKADGVPPSPGRVGAPLVFVICNSWSQAMDRISEKEVVTSLQALVSSVRKLLEQHTVEQTEQIIAIREREKWNKILERKTLEINKEADVLNRKLALVPVRQSLLPSAHTYKEHHLEASSLQASLGRVVHALESFASSSMKAFEEILRHAEGERVPRENAKGS